MLSCSFHSQQVAPLFMRIKTKITDYQIFPALSKAKSLDSTSVPTWFFSLSFKAKRNTYLCYNTKSDDWLNSLLSISVF